MFLATSAELNWFGGPWLRVLNYPHSFVMKDGVTQEARMRNHCSRAPLHLLMNRSTQEDWASVPHTYQKLGLLDAKSPPVIVIQ